MDASQRPISISISTKGQPGRNTCAKYIIAGHHGTHTAELTMKETNNKYGNKDIHV